MTASGELGVGRPSRPGLRYEPEEIRQQHLPATVKSLKGGGAPYNWLTRWTRESKNPIAAT